jgi:hypothetical protein
VSFFFFFLSFFLFSIFQTRRFFHFSCLYFFLGILEKRKELNRLEKSKILEIKSLFFCLCFFNLSKGSLIMVIGGQTRRRRRAARLQGGRQHRFHAPRDSRRWPHLAPAAPRHLLDRGPPAAYFRPETCEPTRAH